MQMVEDLESGKEKLIPFTKEMSDEIDYLVGDMVDEELNDD
jgi:hypothetical protein